MKIRVRVAATEHELGVLAERNRYWERLMAKKPQSIRKRVLSCQKVRRNKRPNKRGKP